jgi:hypothetical protein
MQQVQLYIGDQRIELFKDETISLTETIQNVKDIAKVFTDFTKTFSIPATKSNNKVFKHYYNFDIVGGFDARTKRSGSIKLNGVDFKKGKIKLEGVDLKENKADVYRITFFGDLVELKDLIGEDKLDSLTFLDNFTLDYSATEVKARLQSASDVTVGSETFSDVILAPLISCSSRLYYDSYTHNEDDGNVHYQSGTGHRHGVRFDDLKYAIKVYAIIRAIEEKYGIEFTKNGSDDFITDIDDTTTIWGSLYLWMHRKSGKYASSVTEGAGDFTRIIDNFEEKTVATYTLNGHTWTIESTGDSIVNTGFSFDNKGDNGGDVLPLTSFDVEPVLADASKVYSVRAFANGILVDTESNLSGNNTFSLTTYSNSTMTYEVVSSEAITFQKFEATCRIFELFYSDLATGTVDIVSNFSLQGFQFYPTQQVPEIKVLDFITGLFKTFNLTAYVQDNGKIKLQTLDTFYTNQSTGSPYDITEFMDVKSSKVNVALPFSKVKFVFKESKSLLAAKFNQLNNAQYGQLEYNADSTVNFVGKEYKVEAPWEKMLYERLTDQNTQNTPYPDADIKIQYGLMQNENSQNYLGKPLLFLTDLQATGSVAPISFVENSSTHVPISNYYAPSHTVEIGDATSQTLLYNAEIDTFTKNLIEESLFENYYKEYIQGVFNEKRRLTRVKAFLPLRILLKYTLADTFIIAGKQYKINSITTNLQTGESDMELLNVV